MTLTQRGRLDKRRAILDAAGDIFGNEGYERASIDAIASRSGVSKPTIYNHFATKEQLFRESIAESAATINAQSIPAIRNLDTSAEHWRDGMYALAKQLVECQRSPCGQSLQRMVYSEVKRDPEVFRGVRERAADPIIEALAGRLAMLGNSGFLRIVDPVLAAKQFLALVGAEVPELTELGTRQVDDHSIELVVRAGVDTFLRAYAANDFSG